MIRKSTENDKNQIQELIQKCFGNRDDQEPFTNLNDRYYLYFKDNILIAMTGISDKSEFPHLEIDWTCTHPKYRHNGYMQKLFAKMLKNIHEPVYCSCWRIHNNEKINLYSLMQKFDFKEVVHSREHNKVPHNCFRDYDGGCVYCIGEGCECYEDLFLKEYTKKRKRGI